MKKQVTCSNCGNPGHYARTCGKDREGKKPGAPAIATNTAVSVADLPKVKKAVTDVVSALETVGIEHRGRVIASAQMILGGG